jgi:hypothetical protein
VNPGWSGFKSAHVLHTRHLVPWAMRTRRCSPHPRGHRVGGDAAHHQPTRSTGPYDTTTRMDGVDDAGVHHDGWLPACVPNCRAVAHMDVRQLAGAG